MDTIKWNNSFSVGDLLMDTHHFVFFDIVKQFAESADKSRSAVEQRINFLVEYTIMHLTAEERLMAQAGYPELEEHKKVHRAFAGKVLALRDHFLERPGSIPAEDVLNLMRDWFLNHILQDDIRYQPCVQRAQIRPSNSGTLEYA